MFFNKLFHDGGRYHIETGPLTCSANQWTGFYMITASVMKELSTLGQMKIKIVEMFKHQKQFKLFFTININLSAFCVKQNKRKKVEINSQTFFSF